MPTPLRGTVARLAIASSLTLGLLAAAPAANAAPAPVPAAPTTVTSPPVTPTAPDAPVSSGDTERTALTAAQQRKLRKIARKAKAEKKAAKKAAKRRAHLGGRVMAAAASRTGARYVYGGTGPWAFDCSGFTRWVYQRAGKSLPRTSGAQAAAVRRIPRAAARPGDLVFFTNGSRVYHVGIYAGGNSLVHSSRPGVPVGRGQIWTNQVFFGTVR